MSKWPYGTVVVVDDVPAAFSELIVSLIEGRTSEHVTLALSGGSTAKRCYQQLATATVSWDVVDIYLGDERCVPADSADSNSRLIHEALVNQVPVASFHPMDTTLTPAGAAAAYDRVVAGVIEHGGFDCIHLGFGPDGHTASLFPDSAGLDTPPGVLVTPNLDPTGRNPHERLSFTFEAIAQSHLVVFTVTGAEKAQAFGRLAAGEDLPSARVTSKGRVLWLVDHAALGDTKVYPEQAD